MGQSDSDIANKKVHNSMISEVKALIYVKPSYFYWKLIFRMLWPWYILSKQTMIYWTYWQVSTSWFIKDPTECKGTVNNLLLQCVCTAFRQQVPIIWTTSTDHQSQQMMQNRITKWTTYPLARSGAICIPCPGIYRSAIA